MDASRLGQILIRSNALTPTQLDAALAEQRRSGGKLGEVLVRLKLATETQVTQALARQHNLATVSLEAVTAIDPAVKARIPASLAHAYGVLPIEFREEECTLVVATFDLLKGARLDELRERAKCWILPKLAPRGELQKAIHATYGPPPPSEPSRSPARTSRHSSPPHDAQPRGANADVRALVRLLVDKGVLSAADVGPFLREPGDSGAPRGGATE